MDARLGGDDALTYLLKAAVLRRHLTDDQRGVMAVLWMKEHPAPEGRASPVYGNSPRRAGELNGGKTGPTSAAAQHIFNISRFKIDKANYVQARAPELSDKVHKGGSTLRQTMGVPDP